jgi:hypothetical protein
MFSEKDLLFLSPEKPLTDVSVGGFARQVLILSRAADYPDQERVFLEKILGAAQLNLAQDTCFVSLTESPQHFALMPFLKTKQPAHVLVFGCTPAEWGLRIEAPMYLPLFFQQTTWLWADSLATLEPNREQKGKLWSALQVLFLK